MPSPIATRDAAGPGNAGLLFDAKSPSRKVKIKRFLSGTQELMKRMRRGNARFSNFPEKRAS
jgi:hypothetical protein